jgi:integrase
MIEVRNVRTGFFEETEFRSLLSYLPEELRPVAEFAYLTGWRKQEILKLLWRQVDFAAGVVRLEPGSTKNDEGRSFPFNSYPVL